MLEIIIGIVAAGIGGSLTLAIVAITRRLQVGNTLPQRMERLEVVVVRIAKETSVQTGALKATLEALQGTCNGNVTEALKRISELEDDSKDFFTATAVRGKA
jgi:hypothetical protein